MLTYFALFTAAISFAEIPPDDAASSDLQQRPRPRRRAISVKPDGSLRERTEDGSFIDVSFGGLPASRSEDVITMQAPPPQGTDVDLIKLGGSDDAGNRQLCGMLLRIVGFGALLGAFKFLARTWGDGNAHGDDSAGGALRLSGSIVSGARGLGMLDADDALAAADSCSHGDASR